MIINQEIRLGQVWKLDEYSKGFRPEPERVMADLRLTCISLTRSAVGSRTNQNAPRTRSSCTQTQ